MPKRLDPYSFYRRILADGWRIAWEHKHLWLFGFFAALIGYGSISEVFFSGYDKISGLLPAAAFKRQPLLLLPGAGAIGAIIKYSPYPIISLVIFTLVIAVFTVIFAWIAAVALGALIGSVKKIEQGGDADFASALKIGASRFWQVFGVNALAKIIVVIAFFLTSANLVLLLSESSALNALFYVGSFVIFMVIAVVASLTAVYASTYAVAGRLGFKESVVSGVRLFFSSWLISVEMSILLFLIGIGIGLLSLIALLVLSVPIIFLLLVASALKASGAALALAAFGIVGAVIFIIAAASVLATFQVAVWTLLWTELVEKKPMAKMLRMAAWVKEKTKR